MRGESTIIIAVLLVLGASYSVFLYLNNQRASQLPSVEVREYQGEKLGSITDFREVRV